MEHGAWSIGQQDDAGRGRDGDAEKRRHGDGGTRRHGEEDRRQKRISDFELRI
jgi:hypothetical protein